MIIPQDNNPKSKPTMIIDYNSTKGGVYKKDQMFWKKIVFTKL